MGGRMRMHGLFMLTLLVLLVLNLHQAPITLGQATGVEVSVTTDVNGTVYISFKNVTIGAFYVSMLQLSAVNASTLAVTYIGVYYNSTSELILLKAELYNGSTLMGVFDASSLDKLKLLPGNVAYKTEYYDITGASSIYYRVYDSTGRLLTAGFFYPPYRPEFTNIAVGDQYLGMLLQLLPAAVLVMLGGRGSIKEAGLGFMAYSVAVRLLPLIGVPVPYLNFFTVAYMVIGLILFFFSS